MSLTNSRLKNCGGAFGGGVWYAAHTRYQHEKQVARMLAGKGFEVFLPLYTEVRQWRDRKKTMELPLFTCYVFLRGNLERRLAILTTPGVHGLVCSAGKLAAIPEREIQAVRSVVESRIHAKPFPFLKCGDLVRVKSGALEGLEGFLVRKKGQSRLIISVTLLERSVAAEVDGSMVERVAVTENRSSSAYVPSISDAGVSGCRAFAPSPTLMPVEKAAFKQAFPPPFGTETDRKGVGK